MTWVAIAVGGGALIGAGASYAGSKKQAGAAKDAANLNMEQFERLNAQQQPYIQSGYGALGKLNTLMGLSPRPQMQQPQAQQQPALPDLSKFANSGDVMTRMIGRAIGNATGQQPQGMGGQFQNINPQMAQMMGRVTQDMQPQTMPYQPPPGQPPLQNMQLRNILSLRAQHGDTQAQRMLGMI